jgi:hypothetical protein
MSDLSSPEHQRKLAAGLAEGFEELCMCCRRYCVAGCWVAGIESLGCSGQANSSAQ